MRRTQLEHAIRTACQIIQQPEVIVVGSHAILGTYDESQLPDKATMSIEVDILPIADTNAEAAVGRRHRRCRRRTLVVPGVARLQH